MKFFFLSFFLLLFAGFSSAQWEKTNGPGKYRITGIASNNSRIYTITDTGGVYWTSDNGDTWNDISIEGEDDALRGIEFIDSFIFVTSTTHGIYRSSNNGQSWDNTGLSSIYTYTISSLGHTLYVGAGLGGGVGTVLYKSTDSGNTWLSEWSDDYCDQVLIFVRDNDILYVGTSNGIYYTLDSDKTWIRFNNSIIHSVENLFAKDSIILFSNFANKGIFRSINGGNSWDTIQHIGQFGGYAVSNSSYDSVFVMASYDPELVIIISFDYGLTWYFVNIGLPSSKYVYEVLITKDILYAGSGNTIWRLPLKNFSSVSEPSSLTNLDFVGIHPMPLTNTSVVEFNLKTGTDVSISVYDLLGKLIDKFEVVGIPGSNIFPIGIKEGISGQYYVVVSDGKTSKFIPVIR